MADVADPFLHLEEEDQHESEEEEEEEEEHLVYWSSSVFERDIDNHPLSNVDEDYEHEYHGTDLSDRTPVFSWNSSDSSLTLQISSGSVGSVGDRVSEMAEEEIGSRMTVGLGFDIERQEEADDECADDEDEQEDGLDWGGNGSCTDGECGLRIVGFESESDSEDAEENSTGDLGMPLQWDCLRIDEAQRDLNEDFEWEEVDDRVDERDVLSVVMFPGEERPENVQEVADQVREVIDSEGEGADLARNIEWEVLLAMNNIDRNISLENVDVESYVDEEQDQDDYVFTSDYEVLFGQFVEHVISIKGSLPAAKSVVDNLPLIVLSQEDVDKNNTVCAVCKDDIPLGETVKQLPCLHHYHGECIMPWLGIRNTCPVCRYELPSEDPDYENTGATGVSHVRDGEESHVRYLFP